MNIDKNLLLECMSIKYDMNFEYLVKFFKDSVIEIDSVNIWISTVDKNRLFCSYNIEQDHYLKYKQKRRKEKFIILLDEN